MSGGTNIAFMLVYITAPHHIAPPTFTTIAEREEDEKEVISEGDNHFIN